MILALWLGCSEYQVRQEDPPDVATPPPDVLDAQGEVPDWQNCQSGWFAQYFNLKSDHADIGVNAPAPLGDNTWWSVNDLAFQRYDASLDLGPNWWPVDDGLAQDPQYFAVHWTAWLRAEGNTTMSIVFGAQDDARLVIDPGQNDEIPLSVFEPLTFEVDTYDIPIQSGVHPLDLRYAQRVGADNGFRFRISGGDVKLCYPAFPDPIDE